MQNVTGDRFQKSTPEEKAEAIRFVADRLIRAQTDPKEVERIVRYLYRVRDVKKARELLNRFSQSRRYFGRSVALKRQHGAIEREFFKLLSVCEDVNELVLLGMQVVQLMPYYAQNQHRNNKGE